jgi:hypothetical protein
MTADVNEGMHTTARPTSTHAVTTTNTSNRGNCAIDDDDNDAGYYDNGR